MNPMLGLIYMLFYLIYSYLESFVYLFIPRQKKSVAGKIILVTGAGHGIGRELALQLSRLGARLVLWDVNKVTFGCVLRTYSQVETIYVHYR